MLLMVELLLDYTFGNQKLLYKKVIQRLENGMKSVHWEKYIIFVSQESEVIKPWT